MKPGLTLVESALLAAWLTTVTASYHLPDVSFDSSGRMMLAGNAGDYMEPDDSDPPTGPPNIMCPC